MNVIEWAVGFVAVFDLVALGCLLGYLSSRRSEVGHDHYTFVAACFIFLVGKTLTRITMFVQLWPVRHLPLNQIWNDSVSQLDLGVDLGVMLTSLGAILIVRFIGKLIWGTEWLWIVSAIVGLGLPPLLDYLIK